MDFERQQLNLQGLLRFAVQQSKSDEVVNSDTLEGMDDERKAFLENALNHMTINVIEEFGRSIDILDKTDSPIEDKVNALLTIREHVDNIDFANSFVKVGGTKTLLHLVTEKESQIRVNAIYIIAEMSQNNPFCQKHFVEANIMHLLIPSFNDKEEIASSALHAVSCIIRNFEPGMEEFRREKGIQYTLSCINTRSTRVFIKTCFLIANLSSQYPMVRDEFVNAQAIEKLQTHVEASSGYDIKIESVLYALAELSKSAEWKPELKLKADLSDVLDDIIHLNGNLPQCEEMVAYSNTIVENLINK